MYTYLSGSWLQENDATHPKDTKKSRYSSPVDHRSLDDLWPQITRWSVHKYIHSVKLCALYVRCALSVLQKECRKFWGALYTLVHAIGWKIRYLCLISVIQTHTHTSACAHLKFMSFYKVAYICSSVLLFICDFAAWNGGIIGEW
jgi:hypothetical protein